MSLWRPKSGFVQQRVVEPRLVCNQPSYTILAKIHQPWARTATAVLYYCLFALNLIFEFQTFFTSKHCAKNIFLAAAPYAGSSVFFYGEVVIFAMKRLSHDSKRSEVLKKSSCMRNSQFFGLHDFSTAGLPVSYKLRPRWDDVITWLDFKSETSFGFLSPNYTGQYTWFFCKT